MPRRRRLFVLAPAAALVVLATTGVAFGQAAVQRVDLQVVIEGPTPHAIIRERLTSTAQEVTERLLIGRPVDQLTALLPSLRETVTTVLERVVAGYAVGTVSVQPGTVSSVTVSLRPVGPVVGEVDVVFDLPSVHARVRPLVLSLADREVAPQVRELYLGLPGGALAWAEPILAARARDAVQAGLPGFTGIVQARIREQRLQAGIALGPRDTRVIRFLGVRFRSTSIPTMLLDQHGPAITAMAEPLRGLPVAFAEAQRLALAQMVTDELAAYPPARQYRVIATALLDVGETTYVTVVADSVLFRARVEAQLNIGTRAPGPAVVARLGRVIAPGAELFADFRIVPSPLSLDWRLGAQAAITPALTIGGAYTPASRETTVWASLQVGLDTGLRAAWNLRAQTVEGAVTYRFNEFLSGELVGTSEGDWWLRLISNL